MKKNKQQLRSQTGLKKMKSTFFIKKNKEIFPIGSLYQLALTTPGTPERMEQEVGLLHFSFTWCKQSQVK